MREPAGYYQGAPVGPVCYRRLVEAHPVSLRVVRVEQPELFDECYFVQMGDQHARKLQEKT